MRSLQKPCSPSTTLTAPPAWKYYFVYIAVQSFLVIFAYFFYIETKGYTIEEVSRLFDGKDAAAIVAERATEAALVETTDGKHGETEFIELTESRK